MYCFQPKKKAAAKKTKAKAKVASSTADQPGPSGLQQQVAPSQDRSVDDEQHQLVIDEAMVDQVIKITTIRPHHTYITGHGGTGDDGGNSGTTAGRQ